MKNLLWALINCFIILIVSMVMVSCSTKYQKKLNKNIFAIQKNKRHKGTNYVYE